MVRRKPKSATSYLNLHCTLVGGCFTYEGFNEQQRSSPDLIPCDFYMWGYIKGSVYVSPMFATLQDLRDRVVTAVSAVTKDQLIRVWQEMDCRFEEWRLVH
ncbi:hypothetical protein AVEN_267974-1 [Araneus ventricosus]|uniref:Uncharacterized protein n=1 Tax=Araneus ventricosus TaxID=182803 RepID=A0A4Y2X4N8_ARAVE|nr:hypothetical protein AVEN_267974-1 [Araneus ventricosus]